MGPLAGIRVVEMVGLGPAPYAAMLLADLGADVIRLDRPAGQLLTNFSEPERDPLNRGKRSIVVNLKDTDGPAIALRVIARADVLIEGFRPGVMERLGLGPDVCLARHPGLVYARMTGWGQEGPLAGRAGHDIAYIAMTGAMHAMGPRGGAPAIPLNLLGDFAGGSLFLIVGILSALIERGRSGRGQVVDAAIVDGAASLLTHMCGLRSAGFWTDRRGENLLDGGAPWYAVYETLDGGHMAVGAIEPKFFQELMTRLDLTGDDVPGQWEVARWPDLRARIAEAFKQRTRDEWTTVFSPSDACVAPVLDVEEAAVTPHLAARGTFVERDGTLQPAPAPRLSRTPPSLGRPPRPSGADTDAILREVDLTDEEIAELRVRGIVG